MTGMLLYRCLALIGGFCLFANLTSCGRGQIGEYNDKGKGRAESVPALITVYAMLRAPSRGIDNDIDDNKESVNIGTFGICYDGKFPIGMSRPALSCYLADLTVSDRSRRVEDLIAPNAGGRIGGGLFFLHEKEYVCLMPGDTYFWDVSISRGADGKWVDNLAGYSWDIAPMSTISGLTLKMSFASPWDGMVIREIGNGEHVFGSLPIARGFISGSFTLAATYPEGGGDVALCVKGNLSLLLGEEYEESVATKAVSGLPLSIW